MADIISRLKLESGEFDSKVQRATKGLLAMEQECRKVGGTLAILEKDQKEYVSSLGSMQTVATTTRGKLNELTQAFTELSVQYGRLTEEEKKGDMGQALTASLDKLKSRISETKTQLNDVNKALGNVKEPTVGFSKLDGMLSVLGGNLMTKAVSMLGNLTTSIKETVAESVEMAKASEGIRIAFDRLNRPDLLDKLREATHGTVTDVELMKAAVKFNDFRLPLDEMGTLLAFAQQKAKDTGQSVDYMVDSIVTGLGRQSLMILDNLGLSASEIKERMKQTGDMTKAVGAIIRDQMSSAGGYVETAADRAAAADVRMKNAMEQLGQTFQPLAEAGASMFNSLAVAAMNALSRMRPFFDQFTQAGRVRQQMEDHGGTDRVSSEVSKLKAARTSGTGYYSTYMHRQNLQRYDDEINKIESSIANEKDKSATGLGRVNRWKEELQAVKNLRDEYVKQSTMVFNPPKVNLPKADATGDKTKSKTEKTEQQRNQQRINELEQEYVKQARRLAGLQKAASASTDIGKTGKDEIERNQQRINDLEQEYNRLGGVSAEQAQERLKSIRDEIAALEKRNDAIASTKEQPRSNAPAELKSDSNTSAEIERNQQRINDLEQEYNRLGGVSAEQAQKRLKSIRDEIAALEKRNDVIASTNKQPRSNAPAELKPDSNTSAEIERNQQRINDLEQEYNRLGGVSAEQAQERLKSIRDEIAALEKRNDVIASTNKQPRSNAQIEQAKERLKVIREEIAALEKRNDAISKMEEQAHGRLLPTAADFRTDGLMKGDSITTPPPARQLMLSDKAVEAAQRNAIPPLFTDTGIDSYLSQLKSQMSNMVIGSEQYNKINAQIVDVENIKTAIAQAMKEGINTPVELPDLLQNIFEGVDIEKEWEKIIDQLNEASEKNPVTINTKTGKIETNGNKKDSGKDSDKNDLKVFSEKFSQIGGSVSSIAGGISQLGVEIPEELNKTLAVIQSISSILTGMAVILTAIQATSATTAATSVVDTIVPFAKGGKIPHAASGFIVPGSDYSDRTPILAQSGEIILNRAQQGNLVSQMEGGIAGNLRLSADISAEKIRMVLNNNGRRTGRGEYVTTNFRKS